MSREVIITIPGQGVEPKSPEELILENVRNFEELKHLNPRLVTKYLSPNSYGLYTALVLAGAVTLGVGIKLAVDRANIVKQAEEVREKEGLGRTGMTAILGKDQTFVEQLALKYGLIITNYNGPLAFVLGGLRDKLDHIKTEIGDKAVHLSVEGVYHSMLRKAESLIYKEILHKSEIKDPIVPVIFSTRPRFGETASDLVTELHEQIVEPVELTRKIGIWRETGVKTVIDIGANGSMKKLTGRLVKNEMQVLSVVDPKDRELIASIS